MRGYTLKILGTLAVLTMFMALSGCAMVEHKEAPAKKEVAPQTTAEEQPAPAPAAKPAKGKAKAASADDLKKKRKEFEKQERKLVKLERDMRVGRHKLEKAHMSMEHARLRNAASLAKAEAELELTRRRLAIFNEQSVPSRLAWGQLGLQRAEDRHQEAREELEQLEVMYSEDEFADHTKEIVLERGRRRLERSERDLELRQLDFATLQEKTLPVERHEHELRVIDKEEALKRAREKAETSMIDQEIGLIGAEGEIIRLEHELDDTREAIEDLKEKVAKMEKEVAEAAEESKE